MGAKAFNFNVYKGDIDQIKSNVPSDFTVINISPDWTTIMCDIVEAFDMDIMNVGFELSAVIKQPILHFAYFEEEVMGMTLMKDGEMAATFGLMREDDDQIINLEMFLDEFDIDKSMLLRLKRILKCDDYYMATEMLEELFGVAFMVHYDFFDDGVEEFVRRRGDGIYKAYLHSSKV